MPGLVFLRSFIYIPTLIGLTGIKNPLSLAFSKQFLIEVFSEPSLETFLLLLLYFDRLILHKTFEWTRVKLSFCIELYFDKIDILRVFHRGEFSAIDGDCRFSQKIVNLLLLENTAFDPSCASVEGCWHVRSWAPTDLLRSRVDHYCYRIYRPIKFHRLDTIFSMSISSVVKHRIYNILWVYLNIDKYL